MKRIAIYGAGGFGAEVASMALRAGYAPYFTSDDPQQIGDELLGLPIRAAADCPAVIAIADGGVRRRLAGKIEALPVLLAATAIIGHEVEIGEGSIFCDFSMVSARAKIGRHFHANMYANVCHDCIIGDFVTFAPYVSCNGNVVIEDGVYVGAGAKLRNGIPGSPLRIGRGAVIGMGAVVVKDVPPGVTVVGNPAMPMQARLRAVSA